MTISNEMLFWTAHLVALCGWSILLVRGAPGADWARSAALILALAYSIVFLANLDAARALLRGYSVDGVVQFLGNPATATLGWIHYLAFDLLVGAWATERAAQTGMARGAIVMPVVAICAVGPAGFALFCLLARNRAPLGSPGAVAPRA